MQVKEKYIGPIIALSLWAVVFLDDYTENLQLAIIEATVRVSLLSAAFVAQKYFSRIEEMTTKHKIQHLLTFVAFVLVVTVAELGLDAFEFDERHRHDVPTGLDHSHKEVISTVILSFILVLVSMFISWTLEMSKRNRENQLKISQLEALKKESELNELKNQINPHFLFNALSNIYSIAYFGDKETPDKIMQLSKMLRYVIYDTNVDSVPMEKEIEYINHYIEFQKFKIKKEQHITFDYSASQKEVKVAPLLLLPLVENAFKHSQIQIEEMAWVNITLATNDNLIQFTVENTISNIAQPEILNNSGTGLENVKKRLELIYGEKQDLAIEKINKEGMSVFQVRLEIKE